jgi:hypothetical protein
MERRTFGSKEYLFNIRNHVESANEDDVWVIQRFLNPLVILFGNEFFYSMDQIGQRLSIAAHTTGLKFGSLQVKQYMTAPNDVEAMIISQEEIRKYLETNEEQKLFREFSIRVL